MKKEWNISSDEDGMIIRFEDTGRGLIPSCKMVPGWRTAL
jgi:hypothetical protein